MSSSPSSIYTWILPLKVLLVAAGVAALAMALQFAVSLLLDFAVYDLPEIWTAMQSCLKPLYLYFLINAIILTIVVTSRFHLFNDQENQSHPLVNPTMSDVLQEPQLPILEAETVRKNSDVAGFEDNDEFVISRSTWNPQRQVINFSAPPENTRPELISPVEDRPLVTSRFALQKSTKTSPDGNRALKVGKPKKHDTLEATWKTMTDGRHMPLTRHLRKSDTFDNHRRSDFYSREEAEGAAGKKKKVMKKATTLKDRTNYDNHNHRPPPLESSTTRSSPASGGKRRKEGSLSHDELNRRVEAFIKKFNDEMRLQRDESMKQYR